MDLSVDKGTPPPNVTRPQETQRPVSPQQGNQQTSDSMAAGMVDGETLADGIGTGGKLGAGLGIGALTGLIGTGIGYFVVGPAPMTPEALARYNNRSSDYQFGFKSGWDKKSQSKKRNAFLAGGLLGTLAFLAVWAAAQGE